MYSACNKLELVLLIHTSWKTMQLGEKDKTVENDILTTFRSDIASEIDSFGPKYAKALTDPTKRISPATPSKLHSLVQPYNVRPS